LLQLQTIRLLRGNSGGPDLEKLMSDSEPLESDQRLALLEVWTRMNCTVHATICPALLAGQACPNLPQATYSARLVCKEGAVTLIGFDQQFGVTGGVLSSAIGRLTQLTHLIVHDRYKGLSGTMPTQLGLLTNLQVVDLCCNELSGTVPSELARLTQLRAFGLHVNRLSGTIPPAIGAISSLSYVRLYNNRLSGTAPRFVGLRQPPPDGAIDDCEVLIDAADLNCFTDCLVRRCCRYCCHNETCASRSSPTPLSQSFAMSKLSTSSSRDTDSFTNSSSSVLVAPVETETAVAAPTPLAAIVGGAVGGAALLIAIAVALLLLLLLRRRSRRKEPAAAARPEERDGATMNNGATMKSAATTVGATNYGAISFVGTRSTKAEYDVGNLEAMQ
jgi:hypothetical protein